MATYNFEGKSIIVTGAGAGIGKAVCQKLVKNGAKVIAVSLLQSELDELQEELPGIRTVQVDLSDWAAAGKAMEEIGPVYGLVNNAGIGKGLKFLEITEEAFDQTFSINVKAVINISQIVAQNMIANNIKGAIVNMSSIAAMVRMKNLVYSSSKAAVQSATREMANELGSFGIRVNSVNPTFTDTALLRDCMHPSSLDKVIGRTPLGRLGHPNDMANAVAFLLSEESSMMTGAAMVSLSNLVYSSSKAALQSATRDMANELGRFGIRVNCVNPTFTDTPLLWRSVSPSYVEEVIGRTPLGRLGHPNDMANAVAFLLSEESSMMTGAAMVVDGGYTL